jgi:hypothetical protein
MTPLTCPLRRPSRAAAPINEALPRDDDLGGFQLHSQPTYERGLSQQAFPSPSPPVNDSEAGCSEQQAEDTQYEQRASPGALRSQDLSPCLGDAGTRPSAPADGGGAPTACPGAPTGSGGQHSCDVQAACGADELPAAAQLREGTAHRAAAQAKTTPELCLGRPVQGEASLGRHSLFPVFQCRTQLKVWAR